MLKKGAVGFVQKPYRVAELSRTVAESLRAPRSRRVIAS
jgi:FixJ family two-component response regulator